MRSGWSSYQQLDYVLIPEAVRAAIRALLRATPHANVFKHGNNDLWVSGPIALQQQETKALLRAVPGAQARPRGDDMWMIGPIKQQRQETQSQYLGRVQSSVVEAEHKTRAAS
jgi:hypothetical protein